MTTETTVLPVRTTHPWYRAQLIKSWYRCPSLYVWVRKTEGYLYEPEKTVEVFDGGFPFRLTPEEAREHYKILRKVESQKDQDDITRRRDWEITR